MAGQLKLRRGTTSQLANYIGSEGELTYDTALKSLVLHDGVTLGGVKIPYLSNGLVPSTMLPTATESVVGASKIATTTIAQAGVNDTDIITAKKLREAVNCPSTLKPFSCVAWLSVNTTTSPPIIQGSGNIASVTLLSVGRLMVNFSTTMPDANYCPVISIFNSVLNNGTPNYFTISEKLTDSLTIATGSRDAGASVPANHSGIYLGVFR